MAKKVKKNEVKSENKVAKDEVQTPVEEVFVPEVVEQGVVRDQKKENPMDKVNDTVKVRTEGEWFKVTAKELADLEEKGVLVGYDPVKQEALVK